MEGSNKRQLQYQRLSIVSGKISRGERQLKKQQEQSLKSAHDKLRVTVPVEHFLIQELSHGKYLAKDLLLGQQGSGADTPLEFKDLPKRGNKTRTNKEEGEDAAKKPDKDNDVDPAHPEGDNEVDGGKNSDMGQSSFKVSDHFIDRHALFVTLYGCFTLCMQEIARSHLLYLLLM